jgi:transcription elongation factor
VLVADTRHGTSAETSHATVAKAAHVAAAESATAVSTAAAATAGLRTGGDKAAGKQGARQNHHHSSSHDILHWMGGLFRHRTGQTLACVSAGKRRHRDGLEIGMLAVASTKFNFNHPGLFRDRDRR